VNRGDPKWRPIDARTREPLTPRARPGYYPGYDTLSQQAFWDEATRRVVLARVRTTPPVRFFTGEEVSLLQAICDRLLPQEDRDDEHRIPIVPFIDDRLFSGRGDGYRYDQMPPDPDAYRLGLPAIDAISRHLYGKPFLEADFSDQERVLATLRAGQPPAGGDAWKRMPAHRFFMLLMKDVLEVYYAHPFAWDEIGFGGPAYPRGYMRLEHGDREPWEVDERRYAWEPPPGLTSREGSPIAGTFEHAAPPGQGGTH
jgi:hypothetical protein